MRILIVDDEPGILNSLKASLAGAGHVAVAAGNGLQALVLLISSLQEVNPYDLMVTDYRMEGLNGLDLIRISRQVQPGIPTILMTAYGENSIRREAESLECCSYLEKPFSPEQFHQTIGSVGLSLVKEGSHA